MSNALAVLSYFIACSC